MGMLLQAKVCLDGVVGNRNTMFGGAAPASVEADNRATRANRTRMPQER